MKRSVILTDRLGPDILSAFGTNILYIHVIYLVYIYIYIYIYLFG